jgi:ATP-dependent DNA helicase RecG
MKSQFEQLLMHLLSFPSETEWLEFKHNNDDPERIAKYISGLSNSAALQNQPFGYVVWGIEDGSRRVVGTSFRPRLARVGNQALELWLQIGLTPRLDFRFLEFEVVGLSVVILEIPAARGLPTRFNKDEFVRIGENLTQLSGYPEKERRLWELFRVVHFETDVALSDLTSDAVLGLLDYFEFFKRMQLPLPSERELILNRLVEEGFLLRQANFFSITNCAAILFARDLSLFKRLERKALRVIIYRGRSKVHTIRERQIQTRGYALDIDDAIRFISEHLPSNEQIGQVLREEVGLYPEAAVRELLVNSLIHQDFGVVGAGVVIEVFEDRIEFVNPGAPLIEPNRFLDQPPRSRNETLARLMRRMYFCEERGSGIDKVIFQAEFFQLPPPDFRVFGDNTVAVLFAPRSLSDMSRDEKMRACYQHACLLWVSGQRMTNATVRQRFKIEERNYPLASKIIKETLEHGLVKLSNPDGKSKKEMSYLPFWA